MKIIARAVAATAVCFLPFAALADASTTVNLSPTWDLISQQLTQLFAIVLLGVITWVVTAVGARIKAKFGVDITTGLMQQEAIHRDALQTSLTNAAAGVLQKLGTDVDITKVNVGSPAVVAAVQAVQSSVPEAVANFHLTAAEIAPKILAQLPQVQAPPAAPSTVIVPPAQKTP